MVSLSPPSVFAQAIKVEYGRLMHFAEEDVASDNDYRLQHAVVYFILNQAPKKILERTLLTQFADRNLAFDERSVEPPQQQPQCAGSPVRLEGSFVLRRIGMVLITLMLME